MSTDIRPVQPTDRTDILALAHRLEEGVAAWRDPAAVAAAVRSWVEAAIEPTGERSPDVFVAEVAGGVAGFITVIEQRHWSGAVDTYIGELVVDRTFEGRGIGQALVDRAIQWGRSNGHERVTLHTGAANARARRFYGGMGFEEEDVSLSFGL